MKKILFILSLLIVISTVACATVTPTPFVFPTNTATAAPTETTVPTIVPTGTFTPGYVTLKMDGNCPKQTVYIGQPVLIREEFKFGRSNAPVWFKYKGVEVITINDGKITLVDHSYWSDIVTVDEGKMGKSYLITFTVGLPALAVGSYKIEVLFEVPAYFPKGYLYSKCASLDVINR